MPVKCIYSMHPGSFPLTCNLLKYMFPRDRTASAIIVLADYDIISSSLVHLNAAVSALYAYHFRDIIHESRMALFVNVSHFCKIVCECGAIIIRNNNNCNEYNCMMCVWVCVSARYTRYSMYRKGNLKRTYKRLQSLGVYVQLFPTLFIWTLETHSCPFDTLEDKISINKIK